MLSTESIACAYGGRTGLSPQAGTSQWLSAQSTLWGVRRACRFVSSVLNLDSVESSLRSSTTPLQTELGDDSRDDVHAPPHLLGDCVTTVGVLRAGVHLSPRQPVSRVVAAMIVAVVFIAAGSAATDPN